MQKFSRSARENLASVPVKIQQDSTIWQNSAGVDAKI